MLVLGFIEVAERLCLEERPPGSRPAPLPRLLRSVSVCHSYRHAIRGDCRPSRPDIDFNGKFAVVRRSFTHGRVEKTKTDQIRRVDLSDALLHELQALKRKRQTEYLAKG
jgi:hypothetical protein